MGSFERVEQASTNPHEREHVTVRYRRNSDKYDRTNITSDQVFKHKQFQNRSDLRLTLDEPADYKLIEKVFTGIETTEPTIEEVIQYIDERNLQHINKDVKQKSIYTSESEY
jgi:spore coat polysaccharide biosynthesis protein SpsF